jgi:hypothetical protein
MGVDVVTWGQNFNHIVNKRNPFLIASYRLERHSLVTDLRISITLIDLLLPWPGDELLHLGWNLASLDHSHAIWDVHLSEAISVNLRIAIEIVCYRLRLTSWRLHL